MAFVTAEIDDYTSTALDSIDVDHARNRPLKRMRRSTAERGGKTAAATSPEMSPVCSGSRSGEAMPGQLASKLLLLKSLRCAARRASITAGAHGST